MILGIAGVAAVTGWVVATHMPARTGQYIGRSIQEKTANAGFTLQNIMVEGRVNADPELLKTLIGMQRGDPVFGMNPKAIRERLEQMPWIAHAEVERRLPDTLYIRLTERVPEALWQTKGKLRLIARDGVTLTDEKLERFRDLLLVVGEDAPSRIGELSGLLQGEPDIAKNVEAATLVGSRRWDLRMKNGVSIRLPESDAGLALSRLARAQKEDHILERALTVIDLRNADRIIVATKPGEAQDYKTTPDESNI